mmetsp:Transcript_25722/g.60279  ORF Transcript_25722/g.60279 Transcript_25722/m.60279 type:complete len:903 (+) Transcript_25722:36-2744(+)
MDVDVVSWKQERLRDALATISEVTEDLRRLQVAECSGKVDFSDSHNIAQICQGVAFILLAMWLIFANNSKVAVAQKAPLEERHKICATISTAVALFSGFFNILQLTAIDDFDLPGRSSTFTLNLSRPVEWLATCPIMQLKLVVLAGARVPAYRRFMMPLLSVAVLLCGTASMFTGDALRFAWYGFGLCFAVIMFYHNSLQIAENSEGEESFFHGDSDFRKLSLLLVWTWFPFPIWFTVSVEGFGLITDPFVIEMGWVLLNVVSKFSFIVLLQRMKMVHQNKMEAARQLYGLPPGDATTEHDLQTYSQQDFVGKAVSPRGGLNPTDYGLGHGEEAGSESKLVELVAETMVTMNLGTHSNRMMKLLVDSGISNTAVLERLNQDRCMDLNLPWALISSIQKRWTTEKMNMGQDQGGLVEKEDPFMKILEANRERISTKIPGQVGSNAGTPMNSGSQPMLDLGAFDEQITGAAYRAVYPLHEEMLSELKAIKEDLARQFENSQEAISQRMDFSQVTLLQTVNACQVLLHKLDSAQEAMLQKVDAQKASMDQLSTSYSSLHGFITGVQDSTKQALVDTVNTSSNVLLQKLDSTQQDLLKQSHESHVLLQGVATTQTSMAEKFADGHDTTSRQLMDIDGALRRKLTETEESVTKCCTDSAEKLLGSLREDLTTLSDQGTTIVEKVQRSATVQEERVTDIRRHSMMIMDILNGTQETIHKSLECIQNFTRAELLRDPAAQLETSVREVLFRQMGKLKESLLGEESSDDRGLNLKDLVSSMANRLEASAERLELSQANAPAAVDVEETIKRELEAVTLALATQQRDNEQESHTQLGELLREELTALKDAQSASAASLQEKVGEWTSSLSENVSRVESGLEKVLQSVESQEKDKEKPKSSAGRRTSQNSER